MKIFFIVSSIVLIAIVGYMLFGNQPTNQAVSQEQANTSSDQNDAASNTTMNVTKSGSLLANTEESTVGWSAKKTLVTTNDHNGTIKVKSGNLDFDEGELVSGNFVIDMTSISTEDLEGSKKDSLDKHLKSEDFFDVENHPEASFMITEVKKTETPDEYILVGDLTIKETTNQIEIPATVQQTDGSVTASSDFTIDRTLWNIRYGSGKFFENLGDNVIDDNIGFSVVIVTQ